jgi:hypothetical protein
MLRFFARLSLLMVLVFSGLAMSSQSFGQVAISVSFGPPLLPVYAQPLLPGPGYIWTPGYWAWNGDGYYWVPGTWVLAPQVGFFWTPPYWGWFGGFFVFHPGYWGPHIGFYGGINYGFGYFGTGFAGGRWENGQFFYNRSVSNVNITNITNVYNENVTNVSTENHVSYNGGQGGITARPTPEEEAAANETHVPPVAAQVQHEDAARSNPDLRASVNHGKPPIAATAKPADFKGQGVVAARQAGGSYNPPPANHGGEMGNGRTGGNGENSNGANSGRVTHPNDMAPLVHANPPNTGNAKMDQKYQQQQDQLMQKQAQERQKLQQQQDKEHQQQDQKHANEAQKQQLEQKHQQQTQKLQQQQEQEQQKMQKQQPQHQEQQRP